MKCKPKKYLQIVACILLICSLAMLPVFGDIIVRENVVFKCGGLPAGWDYRKSHVINSATGAGTNYQVKITVHYGSGTDSGEDVYLNGHCRTDFGDVRFTDDNVTTLLDYWMESKTDGDNAVFWVEVKDDLTGEDMTAWTDDPDNPLMQGTETWEDDTIVEATVFKISSNYFIMWYRGGKTDDNFNIGFADSTDGRTWVKDAGNPIDFGAKNGHLVFPYVVKYENCFYMFVGDTGVTYSADEFYLYNVTDYKNPVIMNSGEPVLEPSQAWEENCVHNVGVEIVDGVWHMLYQAKAGGPWSEGYTYSTLEEMDWTAHKSPNNPVLPNMGACCIKHIPDRNALLELTCLTGEYPQKHVIVANYAYLSDDLNNPSSWHNGPIIKEVTNWHAGNPFILDGFNSTYNLMMTWNTENLTYVDLRQSYRDWTLNEFFDQVSGGVYIYVYYGKGDATTLSNGPNTFPDFFEDVEDGDISDWETGSASGGGNCVTAPSTEQAHSGSYSIKMNDQNASDACQLYKLFTGQAETFAFQYHIRKGVNDQPSSQYLYKAPTTQCCLIVFRDTGKISWYDGDYHDFMSYSANTWYDVALGVNVTADTFDIYVDSTKKVNDANFFTSAPSLDKVLFWTMNNPGIGVAYLDNIFIRKYVDPEPSHGIWGTEETTGATAAEIQYTLGKAMEFWKVILNNTHISFNHRYAEGFVNYTIWVFEPSSNFTIDAWFEDFDDCYAQLTITAPLSTNINFSVYSAQFVHVTVTGAASYSYDDNTKIVNIIGNSDVNPIIITVSVDPDLPVPTIEAFEIDNMDSGDWLFAEYRYYNFIADVDSFFGVYAQELDMVILKFYDGAGRKCEIYYDGQALAGGVSDGTYYVSIGSTTVSTGPPLEVIWEVMIRAAFIDKFDVDFFLFANNTEGYESGWVEAASDYCNVYSRGALSTLVVSPVYGTSVVPAGGRIEQGDVFALEAYNATTVEATLVYRSLQHLKMRFGIDLGNVRLSAFDEIHYRVGWEFKRYDDSNWQPGFYVDIEFDTYPPYWELDTGESNRWIGFNVTLYVNDVKTSADVKTLVLYNMPYLKKFPSGATVSSPGTSPAEFFFDLWVNKENASSVFGFGVTPAFFGMSTTYGDKLYAETGYDYYAARNYSNVASFFDTMIDSLGTTVYASEIAIQRIWANVSYPEYYETENPYPGIRVTGFEVFDLTFAQLGFIGIQTPPQEETRVPVMDAWNIFGTGLFAALFGAIGTAWQAVFPALSYIGSEAINLLDYLLYTFTGTRGLVTGFASVASGVANQIGSLFTLLGDNIVGIALFVTTTTELFFTNIFGITWGIIDFLLLTPSFNVFTALSSIIGVSMAWLGGTTYTNGWGQVFDFTYMAQFKIPGTNFSGGISIFYMIFVCGFFIQILACFSTMSLAPITVPLGYFVGIVTFILQVVQFLWDIITGFISLLVKIAHAIRDISPRPFGW